MKNGKHSAVEIDHAVLSDAPFQQRDVEAACGAAEVLDSDLSLVCMPWGESHRPNLALGLIKAQLRKAGIESKILHANILMAQRLGYARYEGLASGGGGIFLPEFLFSCAAFPDAFSDAPAETMASLERDFYAQTGIFGPTTKQILTELRTAWAFELCEEVARRTARSRVVAFTCNVNQLIPALAAARVIKAARPATRIVLGGAQVDGVMGDAVLRVAPWVDAVYKGEAEVGGTELMRWALGQTEKPPLEYVSYRLPEGSLHLGGTSAIERNVDAFQVPDYDDYFVQIRSAVDCAGAPHLVSGLMFESARGCWWGERRHCTFCGLNREGMVYRQKPPEKLLDEILYLSDKYQQLSFYAADNIISLEYLEKFLPRVRDLNMELEFFYETKSNLKRRHLQTYSDARLRIIQPGIESFSTDVLELMLKGATGIQNVYLLKLCAEFGVDPMYNILTGFPGERIEHYLQQLQWIDRILHLPPPSYAGDFVLQRYSPMFFDAQRFGIREIKAMKGYEHLFPKEAELDSLAFYFDCTFDGKQAFKSEQTQLRKAVKGWRRRWRSGTRSPALTLRRGRGFSVVIDERHPRKRKTYMLTGPDMTVLQACADLTTKRALAEETHLSLAEIDQCLERLESMGLVLVENGKVLGLPLPKKKEMENRWQVEQRKAAENKSRRKVADAAPA